MASRNAEVPADQRCEFRIRVNVGGIIIDGDDIFGDGVNIAARLEAMAEPVGICVSTRVHEDVSGKIETGFEDAGERVLKNIPRPVRSCGCAATWQTGAGAARGFPAECGRRCFAR
jgi:adenylate cyclase